MSRRRKQHSYLSRKSTSRRPCLERLGDRQLLAGDLALTPSWLGDDDLPEKEGGKTGPQLGELVGAAAAGQFDNRLIVRFAPGTTNSAAADAVAALGGSVVRELPSIQGAIVRLADADAESAAVLFAAHKDIAYAEPNQAVSLSRVPNDPYFGQQWALDNQGQTGGALDADIDAPEAWDVLVGSNTVVVANIDTGVDYTHEDLAANIWVNPFEVAGDGIDNDGNGYVDDLHGIDTVNGDADPFDDNGHGTHTAGSIGAVGNNGIGVAGLNWNVRIMPLKFLDGSGSGWLSGAIEALDYLTQMKTQHGVNIVASNNSWGGGGYSQALRDAIQASNEAGILFVAAAGNEMNDNDANPSYPASYDLPGIIAVAATDHQDQLAWFSNHGATSVDLGAPGVDVLSTTPGNTYSYYSGTSMATPHVTGAVALLAARSPELTPDGIKAELLTNTDPVAALVGQTVSGGRLNVAPPSSRGTIELDQDAYETGEPVAIDVRDGDLQSLDAITVTVSAASGDTETVELLATGGGRFQGSLATQTSTFDVAGILDVAARDRITATYLDADDGSGLPRTVTTEASIVSRVELFHQDFESGLPAAETLTGSFTVNRSNALLNNGTQMAGHPADYANGDYSYYEFAVDLSAVEEAVLQFDYAAQMEDYFDGFNVQVSAAAINPPHDLLLPAAGIFYDAQNPGPNWSPRPEIGDLAYDSNGQLQTGTAQFDLTAFVGQTAHVRLQFGSDSSVTYSGINFDDVMVRGTPREDDLPPPPPAPPAGLLAEALLELVDLNGLPGIQVGESFDIRGRFRDLATGRGVFAGYSDLTFDPSQIRIDGISHGANYSSGRSGIILDEIGLVDEVGGFTTDYANLDDLVWTLHATALAAGSAAISQAPPNDLPAHEVLVFGNDEPVTDQTDFQDLQFTIGPALAATIATKLVAVDRPTHDDQDHLPTEISEVPLGGHYFVEIWVQNSSLLNAGVTGGYVDVHYSTGPADVADVGHSYYYQQFARGRIDEGAGLVDDLGGATFETQFGMAPEWVKLATIELVATGLGPAMFELSAGNMLFALAGIGNVPWDQVDLTDTAIVEHVAGTQIDLSLVKQPTATDPLGERSSLPVSEPHVHEWEGYWVEVWVSTTDTNNLGVTGASLQLDYHSAYTTASAVEFGPGFDSGNSSIDDATGTIQLSADASLSVIGDDAYALLARVRFEPAASDDVPIDLAGHSFGPLDLGLAVRDALTTLSNGSSVAAVAGAAPATGMWAVPYDYDSNDQIDVGDFAVFTPAFGLPASQTTNSWWADFDRSGLVDLGDFSYFAPNFGQSQQSNNLVLPPNMFEPLASVQASSLPTKAPPADTISVQVVATRRLGLGTAAVPPTSIGGLKTGENFYVELWTHDATGAGLSGAYLDLAFDPTLAAATSSGHGKYALLPDGTIDDTLGRVDDLGGATWQPGDATTGEWTRLAFVEFVGEQAGTATIELSPGKLAPSLYGLGNLPWDAAALGALTLTIQPEHPWQNPANSHDVNGDGSISPLDVLLIVNELNRGGPGELPDMLATATAFLDVNGDDYVSPLDALIVVNRLNGATSGEGESSDRAKHNIATIATPAGLDAGRAATQRVGDTVDDRPVRTAADGGASAEWHRGLAESSPRQKTNSPAETWASAIDASFADTSFLDDCCPLHFASKTI